MDEQAQNQQTVQPPVEQPGATPPTKTPQVPTPPAETNQTQKVVSKSDQKDQARRPLEGGSFGQIRGREKKRREIIRAGAQQVKLGTKLGDMIVPFVSVGVLVLLIVFVFLPFGTQIVETRESTRSVLDEIERNEKKVEKLSSIDLNLLEERLRKITLVVRDEMDVAELAIEVEEMAVGRNVDPTSAELGNNEDLVSSTTKVEEEWVPLYADTISGPFGYKGEFEDLTDFLHALRLESRTILSMGEIDLNFRTSDDDPAGVWVARLSITGYTTDPAHETTIASPVSTEVDQEFLDEIYTRAERYEGDTSEEDTESEETEEEGGEE